jgi:osmoprotectant transport system permease protein
MRAEPRIALALALLPAFAPAQERTGVVVGSKSFPESHLLGELMTELLRAGTELDVTHRSGLGGTLITLRALTSGEIDLYVEYTGTAWSVVLEEEQALTDPMQVFLEVQARSRERFDLEWLQPLGFENTYALVMRRERAEELGVRTLSDLVLVGDRLRGGFSLEFLERPDGFHALAAHYGFALADVRGMEHTLVYDALVAGELDVVDAYSTDGKLLQHDLATLVDDRRFFPPYHAAPVVRRELLERHPEVRTVLERLAFRLDARTMRALNHAVEVEGRPFAEVARGFLVDTGLLDGSAVASPERRGDRSFVAFFLGRWRETLELLGQHVRLTLVAVLLATLLAVPLGIWMTRHALVARLALGGAGVLQTIPSLALLAFLIAVPGLGLSATSAIVALFLYALLPILRNTYTGVRDVDAELVDAARGLGLTPRQVLVHVRLPLATGTILAGVRTATVISVGVATLAAFIGAGGLGEPILQGIYLNDTRLILAGALPAALLALAAALLLGRVGRRLTPRTLR